MLTFLICAKAPIDLHTLQTHSRLGDSDISLFLAHAGVRPSAQTHSTSRQTHNTHQSPHSNSEDTARTVSDVVGDPNQTQTNIQHIYDDVEREQDVHLEYISMDFDPDGTNSNHNAHRVLSLEGI